MATTTSRAPSAVVLPGPDTLTPDQLTAVYDTLTTPLDHAGENHDDDTVAHDARCADQVHADPAAADDPAVDAAAAWHWLSRHSDPLPTLPDPATTDPAAVSAAVTAHAAAIVERLDIWDAHQRHRATFAAWLTQATPAQHDAHQAALLQHAQVRRAQAHLDALRAARATAGAAQAQAWRDLAAMALLYRGAVTPPEDAAPGTYGIPAPRTPTERADPDGPADTGLEEALAADGASAAGGVGELVAQLMPVLGLSQGMLTRRVQLAPRITWLLPHTLARLADGTIEERHLLTVAEDTAYASAAVTRALDEMVYGPGGLGVGPDGYPLPPAALREQVTAALSVLDAAAVRDRSRAKTAKRGTCLHRLADGMARLEVTGPALALAGCQDKLTTLARANLTEARDAAAHGRLAADGGDPYAVPGTDVADPARAGDPSALLADTRGVNAHRFDALVAAVAAAGPADGSPVPAVRLELHLGLPAAVGAGEEPGWLEGYGPLPAWLTRTTLRGKGAVLRRLSTDPYTGDLRTVDSHTYPASWLLHPDDPASTGPSDPDDDPGGGGSGGGGPGGPNSGPPAGPQAGPPARFRGLPVQDLPPVPTEDDAFGPPLTEEELDDLAAGLLSDPCAQGTCTPTDPDDCPLSSIGGGLHDPPAALARLVQRRWGSCTGPGSTVRATRADLDHVITHRATTTGTGGSTCSCNLEPKGKFWHGIKHAVDPTTWRNPADPLAAEVPWPKRWANWRCTRGASHYTSPLGSRHHTFPRRVAHPAARYRTLHPVIDHHRPRDLPPLTYHRDAADAAATFPTEPTF